MSRLETKCLIASAGLHALLFLLLFVAPLLWVRHQPTVSFPELNFIPRVIVDGAMGGGSPAAKAPPAPAPAPTPLRPTQPQLLIAPPVTQPEPVAQKDAKPDKAEPQAAPKRKKSATPTLTDKKLPATKPDEADDGSEVMVGKRKFKPDLTRATNQEQATGDSRAQANTRAAQAAAQFAFAAQINRVVGALGQGLSTTGTSIDVPGPGGEAFADYRQVVVAAYKAAWTPPPDMKEEFETVKARVVILRDGTVESFEIIQHSPDPAIDKSVERLKKLRSIPPFPKGAPGEKRTFVIKFKLTPDSE